MNASILANSGKILPAGQQDASFALAREPLIMITGGAEVWSRREMLEDM